MHVCVPLYECWEPEAGSASVYLCQRPKEIWRLLFQRTVLPSYPQLHVLWFQLPVETCVLKTVNGNNLSEL